MPVLRYFVVVGAVLLGLLYWAGDQGTSSSPALKTAQTVGIPKSFKPQLQVQPLSEVTAVNFASEYDHPQTSAAKTVETKPVKQAETKQTQGQSGQPASADLESICRISARQSQHPLDRFQYANAVMLALETVRVPARNDGLRQAFFLRYFNGGDHAQIFRAFGWLLADRRAHFCRNGGGLAAALHIS
jgi:hypothetical protein